MQGRLSGCGHKGEGLGVSRETTALIRSLKTCPWLWCGAWVGECGESG